MQDYYFDACGAVSGVTCSGSTVTGGVPAIQTWGSPTPQPPVIPQDSCAALGSEPTRTCHANGTGLVCDHTGGDGGRTVSIVYTCSDESRPPIASQPNPSATPPHYVITFQGPWACKGAHPPPSPPPPPITTCGLSSKATLFADMHDGDVKLIVLNVTDMALTITPPSYSPKWLVTSKLDPTFCNASVDFRVAGKPAPPPVPLTATFSTFANPASTGNTSLIVFTDPSGTLAPAGSPVNAWIEKPKPTLPVVAAK